MTEENAPEVAPETPEPAATESETEIKETDIVFDCPYCGKSLAIDYRGAGLTIPCTDCGRNVEVPIPEGMQITDIDSTEEEQEIRIINLRRALAAAEARIEQLEGEVHELNVRRQTLEKARTDNMFRFGVITEKIDVVEKALREISTALAAISETASKEGG